MTAEKDEDFNYAIQWCYRMLASFGDMEAQKLCDSKSGFSSTELIGAPGHQVQHAALMESESKSVRQALEFLKSADVPAFSVPIISSLLRETEKRVETIKRQIELQKMMNEQNLKKVDVKSDNNCYFRSIGKKQH